MEADRQEQHQAAGRGQPGPETQQGADTDGELAESDEDPERDRDMGER